MRSDEERLLAMNPNEPYHPGQDHHTAPGRTKEYNSKSLFFCLVLENPFHEAPPPRTQKVEFTQQVSVGGFTTNLHDDDLLRDPKHDHYAPTKFEKVIEIIRRLQIRDLNIEPEGMLIPSHQPGTQRDVFPDNEFQGFSLNRDALIVSPDGDEMYIKLHAGRKVLLKFAEIQSIGLNTHPYSVGGGATLPYTKDMEAKLDTSVVMFNAAFPGLAAVDDEEGNQINKKPNGFYLDVPDKMRLLTRLIREPWQYGGCGIQIAELKAKKILVVHFFPLHNEVYQQSYFLREKWASFKQMFSLHPFYQVEDHLVKYFGEEVALYFIWIRKYTLFLRYIAFFGLIAGVLGTLGHEVNLLKSVFPLSMVNAAFSFVCVVWGMWWILKWRRTESDFSLEHGQEAQVKQELVRDEFEPAGSPEDLHVQDLFRLQFVYPLTLRTKQDGSIVQIPDNSRKRAFIRYFVSYPIVLILTSAMTCALYFTTYWRFTDPTNPLVSYGSSVCTILIGFVFGILFDKGVGFLNKLENNRTDTEQEEQTISKSFLFYFMSFYFALFSIVLWPSDVEDTTRLGQVANQMLIITIVKPMVQNIQELAMPWVKTQLRIRGDVHGSFSGALWSLITCETIQQEESTCAKAKEGRRLWEEAQLEPYESTSGDYLEITLQYGYMTMFAATFPWAAVAALFYNLMEIRVDARKLLYECQRPVARPAKSIGAWNGIFMFLSFLSVVTNGYLIAVMSSVPQKIGFHSDEATRFKIFVVSQYIFVAFFFLLYLWGAGNTERYHKISAKQAILSNKSIRERIINQLRERQTTTHQDTEA